MLFDPNLQSPYAGLFVSLQEMFLRFDALHETRTAKQITYKDTRDTAIVIMRIRPDGLHLVFARGAQLQAQYPFLKGNGKIVRYVVLQTEEEMERLPLHAMVEESLILAIEHREKQKIRNAIRREQTASR